MARHRAANGGMKSQREHVPSRFFQMTPRTESGGAKGLPESVDLDGEPKPSLNPGQAPKPNSSGTEVERSSSHPVTTGNPPKTARAREPTLSQPNVLPPSRGVKRVRSTRLRQDGNGNGNDWEHENPDPTPTRVEDFVLEISDEDAVKAFYQVRLKELTMKPLRQIVTAWVKRLAPQRNNSFGRYDKTITPAMNPHGKYPSWWPRDAPYNEPSHLKSQHLIPLAVNIMMVHSNTNQNRTRSWISELEEDAEYIVKTTPVENFSSSTEISFNESMKIRAKDKILRSLFDVARSFEDYCVQVRSYEATGKRYLGPAKTVYWRQIPKPQRGPSKRRKCLCRQHPAPEAQGSDTEVDEASDYSSSFHATESHHDDQEVRIVSPSTVPDQTHSSVCYPTSTGTLTSACTQSMGHLHFANPSDVDCKPIISTVQGSFANMNNTYEANNYTCEAASATFTGRAPQHLAPDPSMFSYPSYHSALNMYTPCTAQSYPGFQPLAMYNGPGPDMYGYTGYAFGT